MTSTVYVVTPCMNAAETIDRTINSVIAQAGRFKIRYHVQDGGSTDGTLARLEMWKKRLEGNGFPLHCLGVDFTYVSEDDTGMYDALIKAFATVDTPKDSFMTWINADDMLMPGALALASTLERQFTPAQLSWFGGAICIVREDMTVVSYDRPIPRMALREGLCDGRHWDFVQQEGTFFRGWLWRRIDPVNTIGSMRLAGDWNLWRAMAACADFTQVSAPTGAFRIRPGQLSAKQREKYLAEIDQVVSPEDRKKAFEAAAAKEPVTRRILKATTLWQLKDDDETQFSIIRTSIDPLAAQWHKRLFGEPAPWSGRDKPGDQILAQGAVTKITVSEVDRSACFRSLPNIVAWDADWQFPAITEQHAFHRLSSSARVLPPESLYVAYPWATLIDKLENKTSDAADFKKKFEEFCLKLPQGTRRYTVCQHIHGKRYAHLFKDAGISEVFWSHATHDDVDRITRNDRENGLFFRPFPLFPVQVTEALPEMASEADNLERPYLFSFVGARANQHYLTEARNWILDSLADDSRGLVIGRDSWHYHKIVYDLQVRLRTTADQAAELVDNTASEQFRATLVSSTFSLCPAGSGPNSIRLWESIGAGTIPVILADTWAPPGDRKLWENAAVFCNETPEDIKALPERLAAIAADRTKIKAMRHAMRQLWLLYGPQGFVTDVEQVMFEDLSALDEPVTSEVQAAPQKGLISGAGEDLLWSCAGSLLLDPAKALKQLSANVDLAKSVYNIRAALPDDAKAARHFDAVMAHVRRKTGQNAPAILRGARPKLSLVGRHSHRTPLSYDPIRGLIGQRIEWVANPAEADLIVTGFNIDLKENAATLLPLVNKPGGPRLMIFSEEPLWDITWSGPFTGRQGKVSANGEELAYTFVSHETSDVYAFSRIPYFVLTSNVYAARYANLMAQFATSNAESMLESWRRAPVEAAFFAEHRKGEAYARAFPDRNVAGLSAYRTEVAEKFDKPNILRVGKGWGAEVRRQDLPDWHLDKLVHLNRRVKVVSSYENVHQRHYISEKIFDAFAVGGIPTYWAGIGHGIFDLVEATAFINTYGLDATATAERLANFVPDAAFADAWLDTCRNLSRLFADFSAIQAERRRVAEAALREIYALA